MISYNMINTCQIKTGSSSISQNDKSNSKSQLSKRKPEINK